MADQTQRLEIATVRAEVGSNILFRFTNDAANAGSIPTQSGDIQNLKQVVLEIQQDAAEKISISTTIYPRVAAGLAATADQGIFLVQSNDADEIYTVWQNQGGTAVNTGKTALSATAIQTALDASNEAAQAAEDAADTATARTAGFLAPSATAPVVRDNGLPLQEGDRYFNTEDQAEYLYKDSGWTLNDSLEAISKLTDSVKVLPAASSIPRSGSDSKLDLGWLPAGLVSKLSDFLSMKDLVVVGDATDETTRLQAAFDLAEGKVIQLERGKVYGYSSLIIRANTTVLLNGAKFKRLAPSISSGITIQAGVKMDAVEVESPGGATGDRAVRISGSGVHIGTFKVKALAEGSYNSTNSALEIASNPAGTQLTDIAIDDFSVENMSSAMSATYVTRLKVGGGRIEKYRTAIYLKDVSNSTLDNVSCEFLGAAVDGKPGENGLLIESSLFSGSSHNLTLNNWDVKDSGEHAYRLGGQLAVRNVWFNGCVATRPGSSIIGGRTTSGEWHGGCGFKVLGGNTTTTEYHENIFFDGCGVIDCNLTYGSYPAGHGVNNFQPWLLVMAKNVHLNDCWTKAEGQSSVARYGLLATSCDGVFLSECNFRAVGLAPLRPYEESPIDGYPGSDGPLLNFHVSGGLFEIQDTTPGNGIGLYMQSSAKYNHRNWILDNVHFKGGASATRVEAADTGSHSGHVFDYIFTDTNVNDSTYTTPASAGPVSVLLKASAPWRPLAVAPSGVDGSSWVGSNDGKIRTRSGGAWRTEVSYNLSIADDSFAVVTPPVADTGFVLITGDGTATHIMAWYRATSGPAGSKYAGAANTAVVSTALTGTTGVDGNVTVGIQNNAIYIENRNGSSNAFKVKFLI